MWGVIYSIFVRIEILWFEWSRRPWKTESRVHFGGSYSQLFTSSSFVLQSGAMSVSPVSIKILGTWWYTVALVDFWHTRSDRCNQIMWRFCRRARQLNTWWVLLFLTLLRLEARGCISIRIGSPLLPTVVREYLPLGAFHVLCVHHNVSFQTG